MKLIIKIVVLCACTSWVFSARAETIVHEETLLLFDIDKTTKECVVADPGRLGDQAFYYRNDDNSNHWENLVIPSTITYAGETYTVVGIGARAFNKTTKIKTVILPETIRSIGNYAFYWCVNLESINIPDACTKIGDSAFTLCRKLKSIHLPQGLQTIGCYTFSDCVGLESINIPGSCDSIGNEAFKWCLKLTTLKVEDGPEVLRIGYCEELGLDYQGVDKPTIRGMFSDSPIKYLYLGRNLSIPELYNKKSYPPFLTISNLTNSGVNTGGRTGKQFVSVEFGDCVTDIPDSLFWFCSTQNEVVFPPYLKTIGKAVFYCSSGSSGFFNQIGLTLPETLESIGQSAFSNCTKLRIISCNSVNPPSFAGDGPFVGCDVVFKVKPKTGMNYRNDDNWRKYIIIDPDDEYLAINVKKEGTLYSRILAQDIQIDQVYRLKLRGLLNQTDWAAIVDMNNLYDLDLSDLDISYIPNNIFRQNNHLSNVVVPSNIEAIKDSTFQSCTHLSGKLSLPTSCNIVGARAFEGTLITNLLYDAPQINIGDRAFAGCVALDSIYLHGDETYIGKSAFIYSGLKSIKIGKGVSVGDEAFLGCGKLESVILEDGVKSLGKSIFCYDNNIRRMVYEGYIENIGSTPFGYSGMSFELYFSDLKSWLMLSFPSLEANPLKYATNVFYRNHELSEIEIPQEITRVRDYAFYNCKSLKKITMHEGVLDIGKSSFYNTSIPTIELPQTLKSIDEEAFNMCSNLTKLNVPTSLESIGNKSFANCTALKDVIVHWQEPITITNTTFTGLPSDCYLYVPINTAAAYNQAGWNMFPNLKEAGILTIKANEGGKVEAGEDVLINGSMEHLFSPYRTFSIAITPNEGFSVRNLLLNGTNVIDELDEGRFYVEDPEENMTLSVVFADNRYPIGDVNGDGKVNGADATSIAKRIVKLPLNRFVDYNADANDDGVVNVTDIVIVSSKKE